MKRLSILGSTGSIGTQTLQVVDRHPERYRIYALAGGHNISLLADQIRTYRPKLVSVATKQLAEELKLQLAGSAGELQVLYGEEGLIGCASQCEADVVVTAVVGSQGLLPTLAAIEAGKTIALANKETLVSAGHLVMKAAAAAGVSIIPVDSEHSAIYQCLNGEPARAVSRLVLTASGGSFRDRDRSSLHGVTVQEALKHPNWSMGAKVTIDSATMANKGLEVIEAHWLFQMGYANIDVLIHPESIVHSMVEFQDGSVMAQLGVPDMRVPIQYALSAPDRYDSGYPRLDLIQHGSLHFRSASFERYPMLRLAYEAGKAGGTATTVYNAANEAAVSRFVAGELPFVEIDETVERVLQHHQTIAEPDLEQIMEADRWARNMVGQ